MVREIFSEDRYDQAPITNFAWRFAVVAFIETSIYAALKYVSKAFSPTSLWGLPSLLNRGFALKYAQNPWALLAAVVGTTALTVLCHKFRGKSALEQAVKQARDCVDKGEYENAIKFLQPGIDLRDSASVILRAEIYFNYDEDLKPFTYIGILLQQANTPEALYFYAVNLALLDPMRYSPIAQRNEFLKAARLGHEQAFVKAHEFIAEEDQEAPIITLQAIKDYKEKGDLEKAEDEKGDVKILRAKIYIAMARIYEMIGDQKHRKDVLQKAVDSVAHDAHALASVAENYKVLEYTTDDPLLKALDQQRSSASYNGTSYYHLYRYSKAIYDTTSNRYELDSANVSLNVAEGEGNIQATVELANRAEDMTEKGKLYLKAVERYTKQIEEKKAVINEGELREALKWCDQGKSIDSVKAAKLESKLKEHLLKLGKNNKVNINSTIVKGYKVHKYEPNHPFLSSLAKAIEENKSLFDDDKEAASVAYYHLARYYEVCGREGDALEYALKAEDLGHVEAPFIIIPLKAVKADVKDKYCLKAAQDYVEAVEMKTRHSQIFSLTLSNLGKELVKALSCVFTKLAKEGNLYALMMLYHLGKNLVKEKDFILKSSDLKDYQEKKPLSDKYNAVKAAEIYLAIALLFEMVEDDDHRKDVLQKAVTRIGEDRAALLEVAKKYKFKTLLKDDPLLGKLDQVVDKKDFPPKVFYYLFRYCEKQQPEKAKEYLVQAESLENLEATIQLAHKETDPEAKEQYYLRGVRRYCNKLADLLKNNGDNLEVSVSIMKPLTLSNALTWCGKVTSDDHQAEVEKYKEILLQHQKTLKKPD